ncbi:MAG TPA: TIM barrel protein [Fimbriimonas sp.]
MRLGIGSYSLAWNIRAGFVTHENLLDEAVRLGVQSVQYCDNLSLSELPPEDLERLCARAAAEGVVVEPGTRGVDRRELIRLAAIARSSGCGFVRIVLDRGDDRPEPNELVQALRFWRDEVPDTILAIENHDRFPARTFAELVERLGPDRYGVCLDTANSLGCLEGTEHVVRTLAPYTVNLHVKDIRIQRVWHNMGFTVTGTSAGQGQIDIPWLIGQVQATAESATVEVWAEQKTQEVLPVEEERRMLGESVAYLRSLGLGR